MVLPPWERANEAVFFFFFPWFCISIFLAQLPGCSSIVFFFLFPAPKELYVISPGLSVALVTPLFREIFSFVSSGGWLFSSFFKPKLGP